jgi:hypothetical protein
VIIAAGATAPIITFGCNDRQENFSLLVLPPGEKNRSQGRSAPKEKKLPAW